MKFRISILTPTASPYRVPIWNSLSEKSKLTVFLTHRNPRDNWRPPNKTTWKIVELNRRELVIRDFGLLLNPIGAGQVLKSSDLLIVSGWETGLYLSVIFLARFRSVPTLIFYESTPESHRFNGFLIKRIKRLVFKQATGIVTVGQSSTKSVLNLGIRPETILQLFNPVDVVLFNKSAYKSQRKTRRGHNFLFVGQLIHRKNPLALIDAFSAIRMRHDHLTIVGDGSLRSLLESKIKNLKIEQHVTLLGQKTHSEMLDIYPNHDTLVLPSQKEVWGLVANEALAVGLHVVVSKKAGVVDLIEGMRGVYPCEPKVESISDSMVNSRSNFQGLIHNPEILQFTPEVFSSKLLNFVQQFVMINENGINMEDDK